MSVTTPDSSLPPPSPVRQRSRLPFLIAVIAIVLVLLLGSCITAGVLVGGKAIEPAKKSAEQFLVTVEKGDYAAADKQLTKQTRENASAVTVQEVIEMLAKRRGKPTGHTGPTSFFIKSTNRGAFVTLRYQMTFAKGTSAPLQLALIREDNAWKIQSFTFQ